MEAAPRLKELALFNFDNVISSCQNTDLVETTENTIISLTELRMIADETSISTLKYIVKLLKEVKDLHLLIGKITADKRISANEAETIFEDLREDNIYQEY